jgi:hypothetical protein
LKVAIGGSGVRKAETSGFVAQAVEFGALFSDRAGSAGMGRRAAALTFRPLRSTYPPPAAGPLITDIRRGFEIPEQSSPLAGSTFKRGLGLSGLFGFLNNKLFSRLRRMRTFNDGVQPV